MNERKVRSELKKAGADRIRSDLAQGAYNHDSDLRKIVTEWLSEQDLPVKEAREVETLSLVEEANSISKKANEISTSANRIAISAAIVALIALGLGLLPIIKEFF